MSKTLECSERNVGEICSAVYRGGTVVFPTDTVYGIGCNPYDGHAVRKIYKIKRRGREKPFPVLAFSADDLQDVAVFDPVAARMAERFWPGRVTMILRLRDERLREPLGIQDKIAVRVPGGDCVRRILEGCRLLVGTSANPSGAGPFVDPAECVKSMGDCDVFVDGGTIAGGTESTIVDLTEGVEVKREGAVAKREIMDAV